MYVGQRKKRYEITDRNKYVTSSNAPPSGVKLLIKKLTLKTISYFMEVRKHNDNK